MLLLAPVQAVEVLPVPVSGKDFGRRGKRGGGGTRCRERKYTNFSVCVAGKETETKKRKKEEQKRRDKGLREKGEKKKKSKRTKGKKDKRPRTPSTTSGSEADSETSDSETSSSEEEVVRKKKRKSKMDRKVHWELVNSMWSLADRPEHLQDRDVVEKMELSEIMTFKDHYMKEAEKMGSGSALFGRDQDLKKVKVEKGYDDGKKLLHSFRFEMRLPVCAAKKYWHKLPASRTVYRHFPMKHLGMEGQVPEKTVVRLHNRHHPITVEMLYKANVGKEQKKGSEDWSEPVEVKQIQEALLNYTAVMHHLWPMDYTGLVIQRVLIEARWGEIAGQDDKLRVQLLKRFFNETMRDNSGRAVRGEPPMEYEDAKARWMRVVEDMIPGMGPFGMGSRARQLGGQQLQPTQVASRGGGTSARARPGAARGTGRGAHVPVGTGRQSATVGGLMVCFFYNNTSGCSRPQPKADICTDQYNNNYAHVCNHMDKATNRFCLQKHPRHANH